jgi:hypothetical protein
VCVRGTAHYKPDSESVGAKTRGALRGSTPLSGQRTSGLGFVFSLSAVCQESPEDPDATLDVLVSDTAASRKRTL